MKKISLIIVNYYSGELIKDLLKTLPETVSKEGEVIIVNNSPSEKLNFKEFKNVKIINNEKNLGYGRAVNIGFKESKGEYLLICNPDMKFISGFEKALKEIEKNRKIGIITPLMIDENKKVVPPWRNMEGNLKILLIILGYDKFMLKKERRRIRRKIIPVAPGACFLIPRKIFEKLNGFDEDFFLFKEDEDICRRLRKEKFYIFFCPEWIVEHKWGKSHKENLFAVYHRIKSLYIFYLKHQKVFYPFIRILLPLIYLIKSFKNKKNFEYFLISLFLEKYIKRYK